MAIRYYKLFDLLNRRNMKISTLRSIISSATIAKINKHEHISGETIDKLCEYLHCQPSDIMEYVSLGTSHEIVNGKPTNQKEIEIAPYYDLETDELMDVNEYPILNNKKENV